MLPTTAILILAALGPTPEATKGKAAQDTSASLLAERRAIRETETKALTRIAEGLDGAEAAEIRSWIEPAPAKDGPSRFRPLPEVVGKVSKPATGAEMADRCPRLASGRDLEPFHPGREGGENQPVLAGRRCLACGPRSAA